MKRKRLIIGATVAVLLLSIAAASSPGREALGRVYSILRGATRAVPPGDDSEQQARTAHGWTTNSPASAVLRGTITYFDPSGAVARQGRVSIYRQYPDQIRVDIEHQGLVVAQCFDGNQVWQARSDTLTEREQRDIREWLRMWPERLFQARDNGEAFREAGRAVEESPTERPGKVVQGPNRAKEFKQVAIQDEIGALKLDKQEITYLIDVESSLVSSARWLEEDEPGSRNPKAAGPRRAVRVDFARWRLVEGVLWPMEVTRYAGDTPDWQITLDDLQINRALAATLFQRP